MFGSPRRGGGLTTMITRSMSRSKKFQSALQLAKQAYSTEKRNQTRSYASFKQHQHNQQQRRFKPQNQPFQLYNDTQKTWANQIDTQPILLTEQDIQKWLTFKTEKLQKHKLYLWHATQFDWVPLWSSLLSKD